MSTESTVVPASQLAELRDLAARTLPHAVQVFAPATVREPGGKTVTTYPAPPLATLAGRLHAVSAKDRLQADQPVTVREWDLTLAVQPGVVLTLAHRLVVVGVTAGVVWEVTVRPVALPAEGAWRTRTTLRVTDGDVTPIAAA